MINNSHHNKSTVDGGQNLSVITLMFLHAAKDKDHDNADAVATRKTDELKIVRVKLENNYWK